MISLILKIAGGLVGIFAAWYINKLIRKWVQAGKREIDKVKDAETRDALNSEHKTLQEERRKLDFKLDDFIS